jgi:hypothetical protein
MFVLMVFILKQGDVKVLHSFPKQSVMIERFFRNIDSHESSLTTDYPSLLDLNKTSIESADRQ